MRAEAEIRAEVERLTAAIDDPNTESTDRTVKILLRDQLRWVLQPTARPERRAYRR